MKGKPSIWPKALKIIIEKDFGLEVKLEYRFHVKRSWRIDMVVIRDDKKVAIEIEGGTWTKSRHREGAGWLRDMEKYNEISMHGFILLRFTHTNHTNHDVIQHVKRIFDIN